MIVKNKDKSSDPNSAVSTSLVLYARADCHLCQEMITALQQLQKQISFNFEVIDIDSDPELNALYNEKVPVLMAPHDQQEICHYHLDVAALNAYLVGT